MLLHSDQYQDSEEGTFLENGTSVEHQAPRKDVLCKKSPQVDSVIEQLLEASNLEQLRGLAKAFEGFEDT